MAVITYTALRRLIPAHTEGEVHQLGFSLKALDFSEKTERQRVTSLSGVTETLLFRETGFWTVQTGRVHGSDLPLWQEFFSSVKAGEPFTFDAANNPITCDLDNEPRYTRGRPPSYFFLDFRVRIL